MYKYFSDKFGKTSSDSSYDFYDKLSKDVNKYIKKIMKENDCSKEEAYDKLSIWFKSISSEAFAHFFEAGMSDKSTELFILVVLTITMLCSCKNKINEKEIKINETADSIEEISITYRTDISRTDMYDLEIDFTSCKATLTHEDDDNEITYSITDSDKLANFIINNVLKKCKSGDWEGDTIDMNSQNVTGNQDTSDTKKILWDISVLTTNDLYTYSLFDKYPAFWYDMWNMICEVTGQSYSTYGIQEK